MTRTVSFETDFLQKSIKSNYLPLPHSNIILNSLRIIGIKSITGDKYWDEVECMIKPGDFIKISFKLYYFLGGLVGG